MTQGRFLRLGGVFMAFLFLTTFNYSCKKVQEVKQDVLEYSLNQLGDKLFSMIDGDIPGIKMLQEKYVKFKESALSGQVSQNEIESVSANILNASNSEKKLTPDQAEKVLFASVGGFNSFEKKLKKDKIIIVDRENRDKLGEGLKNILDFNDRVYKACKGKSKEQMVIAKKIHYEMGERLHVEIDEELQTLFDEFEMEDFKIQIKEFEEGNVLKWQKDLEMKLAEEQKKWEEHMAHYRIKMEKFDEEFSEEMMGKFKYLEELDEIKHVHIIDADSIEQLVERSLKAAGIEM